MSSLQSLDVLTIEVRQAGVVQDEIIVSLTDARRTVRFGRSSRNDLRVPFSNVPPSLSLFRLTAGRVCVLLDPRIGGYINSGSEFGTVADFLSPEGAIERLAAIEDPLEVQLSSGARGVLEIGDFDILFKIDRRKPERQPTFFLEGAKGSPFAPAATDSRLEALAPFFGLVFALLIFIPATIWLTKSPHHPITSLRDLPPEFVVEFIHPEHIRFLPLIFEDEFRASEGPKLAIKWVEQLQARWHAEAKGTSFQSDVPILKGFSRMATDFTTSQRWEQARQAAWQTRQQKEKDPALARFYEFADGFPEIVAETSGGPSGSLYLQQLSRIERLDRTYEALRSLIDSEQEFITDFYTERGLKRPGAFADPEGGDAEIEGRDSAFATERRAYLAAEGWAMTAERSRFFAVNTASMSAGSREVAVPQPSILWLSPESELFPKFLAPAGGHSASPEDDLIENAKYALSILDIPPAPAPTPVISRKEVDLVILDRREEVRGCYEDVLSRDPNLEGTLTMSWWIETNGSAKNVRVVTSSLGQPRLIRCLEKLILNWKFPKPRYGAVKVEYPFRFVVEK